MVDVACVIKHAEKAHGPKRAQLVKDVHISRQTLDGLENTLLDTTRA